MFNKSAPFAKTGKLLVTVVMAANDPTGLTAAGVGLDAYLNLHDTLTARHPALKPLASEISKQLDKSLETPTFHCPQNAKTLLPQMVEAALPAADSFVKANLNPDKIITLMTDNLSDPEHTTAYMLEAFKNLYLPILTRITTDPRLTDALAPAIARKQLETGDQNTELLQQILANQTAGLSPQDLIDIARRFNIPDAANLPPDALREQLFLQAEQLTDLQTRVAELEAKDPRYANLLGAARAALETNNIKEARKRIRDARNTLRSVDLLPALSRNAEFSVLDARAALAEGSATEAFDILSATADSFAAIDPQSPLTLRNDFAKILYQHAVRYGGDGLPLAAKMWRAIIERTSASRQSDLWATAQNNLAIALRNQATRTGGAESAELLTEAVQAYREALTVRTKADHPVDWAGTQLNMAIVYLVRARHDGGDDPAGDLNRALAHVDAALTVYDPVHLPYDFGTATTLRDEILAAQAAL